MITNTFEQRLAYQIGVKLAQEAYLEKEASWANVGKGIKSFASGGGWTAGAGKGFGATMKELGTHLKNPWQEAYKTYGAKMQVRGMGQAEKQLDTARAGLKKLKPGTPEYIAAEKNIATLETQATARFGNQAQIDRTIGQAQKGFIPRQAPNQQAVSDATANLQKVKTTAGATEAQIAQAEQALAAAQRGAVDYRALGTMAGTGALALGAGYGAYNLGRSALGMNNPQPQVAPHQYYMNQLFGS